MTATDRQTYRALVAQVVATAKDKLPQEVNGRVDAAARLVINGDVDPQNDGSILVGSRDPTRYYVLTGHACTCTDFVQGKAPGGWCKHRISAGILKRVTELLPQAPVQIAAPVEALPEAPASANCYITMAGRQVQLTLRDSDEARLLARLATVLDRYPAPAPATDDTRPCPLHHVPMHFNKGKDGRSGWWSHKKDGGQWCQGKAMLHG